MDSKTWPEAKHIIHSLGLMSYIKALLDYWESHPPTPSHGFSHILKVITKAHTIGVKNKYPDLASLIIGAIFHDIYRPVEGKDADEDQTPGASIAKQILEQINTLPDAVQKIYDALLAHDSWRGKPEAPIFAVMLSLADKATHDPTMVYSYAWASNKNIGKLVYSSHLQTLYGFSKYQVRAWEVIYKHQIPGHELAANTYLNTFKFITDQYQTDPTSKNFSSLLNTIANTYKTEELAALTTFNISPSNIKKIMKLC